jgi:hypothetical protein
MRAITQLALSTLLVAMAGCGSGCSSDPRQHAFDDYLTRLSRALQQQLPPPQQAQLLSFPDRRELLEHLPETGSIALLDFLGMADCELQQTLAQRNSSLGKLGTESQRLLHDLAFIHQAPDCIATLQQRDEELAQQLQTALDNRRSLLPASIWHATLGAREFGLFWQAPLLLQDYPQRTGPELLAAIESLQRMSVLWLQGSTGAAAGSSEETVDHDSKRTGYAARSSALEAALDTIRGGDGGRLYRALALQAAHLERGNAMARQRLDRKPLCYPGRNNPQGDILLNVVQKFWLQGLQGWSAQLSQRYYQLWPALQSLEATLAAGEPAAYRRWRQQRDQQIERLLNAPRHHVAAIRPLLEQCGLAPGQDQRHDR